MIELNEKLAEIFTSPPSVPEGQNLYVEQQIGSAV